MAEWRFGRALCAVLTVVAMLYHVRQSLAWADALRPLASLSLHGQAVQTSIRR